MTEPDEPDEHRRYAQYLRALATVPEDEEADLVATVLRDPDPVMAGAAVVEHLDDRARHLPHDRFTDWAHMMAEVVGEHEFATRRLREWVLLRSISDGRPWTAEDVTAASDWCQRQAAATSMSPDLLAFLATNGRTRRVRATASRRQHHR